jgi:hypothetical protein
MTEIATQLAMTKQSESEKSASIDKQKAEIAALTKEKSDLKSA